MFANCKEVLEIGSGTGQHAVYFAQKLPHLVWHSSDVQENHAGIKMWLDEAKLANTPTPLLLDVNQAHWPELDVDAVFCANTIHIIDWDSVRAMIAGAGQLLPDQGILALYGPFNYDNAYTSESNARFDTWLRQRNPDSGIRNLKTLTNWLIQQTFTCNTTMPCRRITGLFAGKTEAWRIETRV